MKNNAVFISIGLILVCGLLFRLPLLNGSFWLDEAAQALESIRPLNQQLLIREDFQPPLLHILVHFATYFGIQEWWLRTIGALIPGLVTIYFTYLIGKKIKNEALGLSSAFLLATSSFHIFYSQELRPYSLPAMIAAISWWIVLQLKDNYPIMTTEKKNKQGGHQDTSIKWWIYWTIISIAGLYASYLYPFLLIGQVFFLFWQFRKRLSTVVFYCFFIGLGFLPWLPSFLDQLSVGQNVRASLPNWETVVSTSQPKALFLVFGKFLFGVLNLGISVNFIYLTLLFLVVIGVLSYMYWNKNFIKIVWPICCWLVIPVITAWAISFIVPVLQPKRVLFALPAFYMFISYLAWEGIDSYKIWLKYFGVMILALVLSLNIYSSWQYYTQPELQRENWRDLVATIQADVEVDKSVAFFAFPAPFPSWVWYNKTTIDSVGWGALHVSEVPNLDERIQDLEKYSYVITFDYLRDLTDPNREMDVYLTKHGFVEKTGHSYPNIGAVRILVKDDSLKLIE